MLPRRFWSKVDVGKLAGCWEWQASTHRRGYGQFFFDGKVRLATRVIMSAVKGRGLLKSELVLHKCDNPKCCNPKHLYLGDNQRNSDDRVLRARSVRPAPQVAIKRVVRRALYGGDIDAMIEDAQELLEEGYTPLEISFKTGLEQSLFS